MKITSTRLPEVLLIEPKVFGDERGFFYESFSQRVFDEAVGRPVTFVQDNHSQSQKGVLRGLHYQMPPHAQGKLVRVVEGEVFDVAVDIRKSSPRFGQWVGVHLSAQNKYQLWIPEGFAHGFYTISEKAQFLYKTTKYYAPTAERCIAWDDSTINITWPTSCPPLLANKDANGSVLYESYLFD
jgi:dTDP-4-dehydrorhamnose 3,5-epimerase